MSNVTYVHYYIVDSTRAISASMFPPWAKRPYTFSYYRQRIEWQKVWRQLIDVTGIWPPDRGQNSTLYMDRVGGVTQTMTSLGNYQCSYMVLLGGAYLGLTSMVIGPIRRWIGPDRCSSLYLTSWWAWLCLRLPGIAILMERHQFTFDGSPGPSITVNRSRLLPVRKWLCSPRYHTPLVKKRTSPFARCLSRESIWVVCLSRVPSKYRAATYNKRFRK